MLPAVIPEDDCERMLIRITPHCKTKKMIVKVSKAFKRLLLVMLEP